MLCAVVVSGIISSIHILIATRGASCDACSVSCSSSELMRADEVSVPLAKLDIATSTRVRCVRTSHAHYPTADPDKTK